MTNPMHAEYATAEAEALLSPHRASAIDTPACGPLRARPYRTVNAHPYPQPADQFEAIINFHEWNSLFAVPGDYLKTGLFFGPKPDKLASYLDSGHSGKLLYVVNDVAGCGAVETAPSGFQLVQTFFGPASGVNLGCNILSLALIGSHPDREHDPRPEFMLAWNRLAGGGGLVVNGYSDAEPRRMAMIDALASSVRSQTFSSYRHKPFNLFFMLKK